MTRQIEDLQVQTGVNITPVALLTDVAHAYTAPQSVTPSALTDGATIAWNAGTKQVATVTLGGNRTLSNPTNQIAGARYTLIVTQDGTGNRTLAFGTAYLSAADSAVAFTATLSTAAASKTVLSFVSDGTNMFGTVGA